MSTRFSLRSGCDRSLPLFARGLCSLSESFERPCGSQFGACSSACTASPVLLEKRVLFFIPPSRYPAPAVRNLSWGDSLFLFVDQGSNDFALSSLFTASVWIWAWLVSCSCPRPLVIPPTLPKRKRGGSACIISFVPRVALDSSCKWCLDDLISRDLPQKQSSLFVARVCAGATLLRVSSR
jgi:hypothetical protein